MTTQRREEHVSESAEKISAKNRAFLRSYSDIPYAREMLGQLIDNPREVQESMFRAQPIKLLINAAATEAASKRITKILKDSGIKQVLDVAAGFSPRGLHFTRDPSTIYVEADLGKVVNKKREAVGRIMERAGISRSNLFFHSANAFSHVNLSEAYLHFDKRPVAIITEELVDNLYISEKRAVARNIRSLLIEHEGIWITSNISVKQKQEGLQHVGDILRHKRDEMLFNSQYDLGRFFKIVGLKEERKKTLENPLDLSIVMKAPRTLGIDISPLLVEILSNDITRILRI